MKWARGYIKIFILLSVLTIAVTVAGCSICSILQTEEFQVNGQYFAVNKDTKSVVFWWTKSGGTEGLDTKVTVGPGGDTLQYFLYTGENDANLKKTTVSPVTFYVNIDGKDVTSAMYYPKNNNFAVSLVWDGKTLKLTETNAGSKLFRFADIIYK